MKVLIIGAGGFIGQHLSASLERAGADVLASCRGREPFLSTYEKLRTKRLQLDLQDVEVVRRILDRERPDAVVHLASSLVPGSNVAEYMDERDQLHNPMLRLLLNLAERDIKIVYFSSGGAIYGRSSERLLSETDACKPINFYGQSKLEAESLVRFVARTSGLRYLIIRPSNPYGGRQSLRGKQGVIGAIMGCMLDTRALQIWGDGSVTRDFIYIDDLCESVTHLLSLDLKADTLNIGSGVGHSILDVVGIVEAMMGRRINIDFHPPRVVDVPRVVLDITRLREFRVPLARSLSDGLRKTIEDLGMLNV